MRTSLFLLSLLSCVFWTNLIAAATEKIPVDVEIVLAVDVSNSVSAAEHIVQIEGIARAFENPNLQRVIDNLPTGGIAVALLLWAGENQQIMIVPWFKIDDKNSAQKFAAAVRSRNKKPWDGLNYTAIGDAMIVAGQAIATNNFIGRRKVVDVSSDDPSNRGLEPSIARDLLLAQGLTINGLPILADRHDQETRQELVSYFTKNIIGGPRSFVNPSLSFDHYADAILQKLTTEISGRPPDTWYAFHLPVSAKEL